MAESPGQPERPADGVVISVRAEGPAASDNRSEGSGTHLHANARSNGQVLLACPSTCPWAPRFDLALCRDLLAAKGVQIPVQEFDRPFLNALDSPSIRRYLLFNSTLFQLFLAPAVYMVIWCGLYSSLHLYLSSLVERRFWLFCLSVSVLAVLLTSLVLLILGQNNRKINMNTDVRLIQANEVLSQHELLTGVWDTVQNCSSLHQLLFVHFDLSGCRARLTELLEEQSFVRAQLQSKLHQRLAHLLLLVKVATPDPEGSAEAADSEETPLLLSGGEQEPARDSARGQQREPQLSKSYSLVPEGTPEEMAHRLLLTYGAVYVRLLAARGLPSEERPLHVRRTNTPCLCQYVEKAVLR
ncbi:transmembrane protein 268 [Lepisosteus oculatus]|uniref:transmembrane protein 268 n=1 Tax=Lepisosteus oculatus TaxID=7918 RepID=UPI0035F50D01